MTFREKTLTPWTQAGRALSKGISKLLPTESARFFEIALQRTVIPHLPEAFEGLRIVQLSDIHYYEFSCPLYHQRVVDAVNELKADIIVTTGDIIHYGHHFLDFGHSFLSQLKATVGKWACMGNHDYSDDYRGLGVQEMLTQAGFQVLINDAFPIDLHGKRLWLSGIDDIKMSRPDPHAAYQPVEKDTPHICLIHNPQYAPVLAQQPKAPDIILAGHTHGGQIRHALVNWVQKHMVRQPYQYGWFQFDQSKLYVTSGVGSASVAIHLPHFDFALHPFRVNCSPEIAVFDLTRYPMVALETATQTAASVA